MGVSTGPQCYKIPRIDFISKKQRENFSFYMTQEMSTTSLGPFCDVAALFPV